MHPRAPSLSPHRQPSRTPRSRPPCTCAGARVRDGAPPVSAGCPPIRRRSCVAAGELNWAALPLLHRRAAGATAAALGARQQPWSAPRCRSCSPSVLLAGGAQRGWQGGVRRAPRPLVRPSLWGAGTARCACTDQLDRAAPRLSRCSCAQHPIAGNRCWGTLPAAALSECPLPGLRPAISSGACLQERRTTSCFRTTTPR